MFIGNMELWTIPSSEITLEGETDLVNTKPSETYIVPDSGTTFALIPNDDFLNLLKIYDKVGINCVEQAPSTSDPIGAAKCTSKIALSDFPDL